MRKEYGGELLRTYSEIIHSSFDEDSFVEFADAVEKFGLESDKDFIDHVSETVDAFNTCKEDMRRAFQWQGKFNTDYPSKVDGEIYNVCAKAIAPQARDNLNHLVDAKVSDEIRRRYPELKL